MEHYGTFSCLIMADLSVPVFDPSADVGATEPKGASQLEH